MRRRDEPDERSAPASDRRESDQAAEDEAFRPAGRAGNDIPGLQAVLFNVPQRAGSGINS